MKKIILLFFLMFLVVPLTSAFNFDNVKSYDAYQKKVTVTNAFGLGDKIADIRLNSELINYVLPGKDRMVAEMEFYNFDRNYGKALNKMELFNSKDMSPIQREFTYKYKLQVGERKVNDYDKICEEIISDEIPICQDILVGSHTEPIYEWVTFTEIAELPAGSVTVGIFTDVYEGDSVEWIPTFFGVRINEWAVWTSSFNEGLITYYYMNETAGNGIDWVTGNNLTVFNGMTRGADGLIGNSYKFTRTSSSYAETTTFNKYTDAVMPIGTISLWFNWTSSNDDINILNGAFLGSGNAQQFYSYIDDRSANDELGFKIRQGSTNYIIAETTGDFVDSLTLGEWHNFVIRQNGTGISFFVDGIEQPVAYTISTDITKWLGDVADAGISTFGFGADRTSGGAGSFYQGSIDEFAMWNRSLSSTEITDLYNSGAGISYFPGGSVIPGNVSVSLIAPANGTLTGNTALNFSSNNTVVGDMNHTNSTLYIWNNSGSLIQSVTNAGMGIGSTNMTWNNTELTNGGLYHWNVYGCAENSTIALCTFADQNFTLEIDISGPTVTINLPTPFQNITDALRPTNVVFNATITDANGLGNCTYWTDEIDTNVTYTCNTNPSIQFNNSGEHTIYAFGNDTLGNFNIASVNFSLTGATNTTSIFNATTYSTQTESFTEYVSIDAGKLLSSAKLIWNNQSYAATLTSISSTNYSLEKTLTIPSMTSQNVTFYWNVTFTDGIEQQMNNKNQEVLLVNFTLCDVTTNTTFINFTIYNATTPYTVVNSTFKANWEYWIGDGSVKNNYSYDSVTDLNTTYAFCSSPAGQQIHTNLDLEFSSLGFAQNYFYLSDEVLNSSVTQQDLYLLSSGLSTLTELNVLNDLQSGLPNYLIKIYQQDIGAGTEILYAIAETNFNGEDIIYLNWYDTFYRFEVYDDSGNLVKSVAPTKVFATPQIFRIVTSEAFVGSKFQNLVYNLSFIESSRQFVLTYLDPSSSIDAGCLRVIRSLSFSNSTILYDHCLTSTSGTINYAVPDSQNGTFYGVFYAKGSIGYIDSVVQVLFDINNDIYSQLGNVDGSILALLLTGTMAFFGMFFGPVGMIVMALMGYTFSVFLGFQSLNDPGMWAAFISLVVFGGYLVIKMRR